MALNISQTVEAALVVEDQSFVQRVGQVAEQALILIERPDQPLSQVSNVTDIALIQQVPFVPNPSPLQQAIQVTLIAQIDEAVSLAGAAEVAIVQQLEPIPDPAFVASVVHQSLLVELPVVRVVQAANCALVVEEELVSGISITQTVEQVLLAVESAPAGTITSQAVQTALVVVQQPISSVKTGQVAHVTLHVDISGFDSKALVSSVTNTILCVEEHPVLDPTRQRSNVQLVGKLAGYPEHLQSNALAPSLIQQAVKRATYPQSVMSNSLSPSNVLAAVLKKQYDDFANYKSMSMVGVLSQNVAYPVTKTDPLTVKSNAVMPSLVFATSIQVTKQNPVGMKSNATMGTLVNQTAVLKTYGVDAVQSDTIAVTVQQTTVIRKVFPEAVQSDSLVKRVNQSTARVSTYRDLALIRSTAFATGTVTSTSIKAQFLNPQDIIPILSLSSIFIQDARHKDAPEPETLRSQAKLAKCVISASVAKEFEDPELLAPNRRLSAGLVNTVVVSAVYDDPLTLEAKRRNISGAYFVELEQ